MSEPVPNPYANPAPNTSPISPSEEKQWSILTHVLSIFFGIIPAIIFYVLYKDRGPFVRAHTLTELNFQITLLVFEFVGFLLAFGSFFISIASVGPTSEGPPSGLGLFFLGYALILLLRLLGIIYGIVASLAANRGQFYRYPLAIRFLK